jgi:phosphatidylglycerol---prolipoprotein diacylglyceryl transferase
MTLLYVNWDVSPEIFNIPILSWHLSVRWYGLFFALGFVIGYFILSKIFKKEKLPIELLDSLTIYVVLGTVIGSRLGHCLFYEPAYYLSHPFEIIKIWHGGLASHGGAIGLLVALYFFTRKHKKSYLWIFDRLVIVTALAAFFIRMGNLMNSEIYGVQTSLPWGFIFIREGELLPKHPTQIYEALSYLAIFVILLLLYRKKYPETLKTGYLFGLFLVLLFTVRFFIEFIKNDQVNFEQGMSLNMGQLLSLPFILAGIILLYYSKKQTIKQPI